MWLKCRLLIFYVLLMFDQGVLHAAEAKKILFISAELPGVLQTGGLAAAVEGLSTAVANHSDGAHVDVLVPYYASLRKKTLALNKSYTVDLDVNDGVAQRKATFSLHQLAGSSVNARTLLLHHEPQNGALNYFDNSHGGYSPKNLDGEGFGALSKAQADFILSQDYDLVVLNDWHTSLVALFLQMAKASGRKIPKVMTIVHNLGYQGNQWQHMLFTLGIPRQYFEPFRGVEAYGQVNFLKASLQYSDLVMTVSGQYAKEITTTLHGAGLDGLLTRLSHEGKLAGMLNGIIESQWDPSRIEGDRRRDLHWSFNLKDLSGKSKGKLSIQNDLGLPKSTQIPVYVLTSRIAEQKGFEYLLKSLERFLNEHNAQVVISGDDGEGGRSLYLQQIRRLEAKYPDQFKYLPFSHTWERKLIAYGDFFINAPWFEPSGLNQMYAMLNGTLPVVTKVGGLLESVKTSFGYLADVVWNPNKVSFNDKPYLVDETASSVYETLTQSYQEFNTHPERIEEKRIRAMSESHSWSKRVSDEFSNILKDKLDMDLPAQSSELMCKAFYAGK